MVLDLTDIKKEHQKLDALSSGRQVEKNPPNILIFSDLTFF